MMSSERAYYGAAPIVPYPLCWNVQNVFTSAQTSKIFFNLFPSKNPMVVPLASLNSKIYIIQYTHILNIHFIPHYNGSIFKLINSLAKKMQWLHKTIVAYLFSAHGYLIHSLTLQSMTSV